MGRGRGNRNRKQNKMSYEDSQQSRYLQRELQKNFFPVRPWCGIHLDWYQWNDYCNQPQQKYQIKRAVLNAAPRGAIEAWIRLDLIRAGVTESIMLLWTILWMVKRIPDMSMFGKFAGWNVSKPGKFWLGSV